MIGTAKSVRILGFSLALPALIACSAVSPDVSAPSILSQRNVIVWDAKTKTEHFVRQAAFETETKDFGFIVATPSLPKVSEVDHSVLYTLVQMSPENQNLAAEYAAKQYDAAPAAGYSVDVMQVENAGAYTITTVGTRDSAALESWLRANKYHVPADIREWIDSYVKKGWLFSAFKFKADRVEMMGKLPCLSFKTDEPFAPYRVPKSNRTKTESLEIYFISDQPYGGFVQNQRQNIDEWCARVRDHHQRSLSGNFKEQVQIPSGWVATHMKADFPTDAPDDLVFRPVNKGVFEMGSYTSPLESAAWIGGTLIVVGCVVVLFRSRGIHKGGANTLNS